MSPVTGREAPNLRQRVGSRFVLARDLLVLHEANLFARANPDVVAKRGGLTATVEAAVDAVERQVGHAHRTGEPADRASAGVQIDTDRVRNVLGRWKRWLPETLPG